MHTAGSNGCDCKVYPQPGPTLASTCGASNFVVFMSLLEAIARTKCDIEDPCGRPASRAAPDGEYDFIVVGGGTAGSVVASRLSEVSQWKVLLIEAGGNEPTGAQIPSMFQNYLGSAIDWNYLTEPEAMACLNKPEKRCTWPRGKVLGGTSVIHGMMYVRGSPLDFDHWARSGNPGWSYKEVLPYFLKSEDNQQMAAVDARYHGAGGPLPVSLYPYQPPMVHSIVEAGLELGYPARDLNGAKFSGFSVAQMTSKNGVRYSTARAFLRRAKDRPNLHVMLNATATRVLIEPRRKTAYGVEVFTADGRTHRVRCKKEVVLSCGAVNSPQLLLLSGVGPERDLRAVNVRVVHDLPGVGRNLHNHVSFPVHFKLNESLFAQPDLSLDVATKYLSRRDGPMSSTGLTQVTAIVHSAVAPPVDDYPDLQFFFNGYWASCAAPAAGGDHRRTVSFTPSLTHPKSRGWLRLKSDRPFDRPAIRANYLSHRDDVDALLDGVRIAKRLAGTRALRRYGLRLDRTPVRGCEAYGFDGDGYWECAVRRDTGPENHQAGSCRMGPRADPTAVVDARLRVHGVNGLRVMDASIMPLVTSANTMAPVIMIAEKGSDMIKDRWLGRKTNG